MTEYIVELIRLCNEKEITMMINRNGLYLEKYFQGTKYTQVYAVESLQMPNLGISDLVDMFLKDWNKKYQVFEEEQVNG